MALLNPWESGRDTSADWDDVFSRVPNDGLGKFTLHDTRHIIDALCVSDITDYGDGRFDEMGLFLFTLRNCFLADLQRGGGMCYAEKLMISQQTKA